MPLGPRELCASGREVILAIPPNGPQVAEGGSSQTLKRSTDMENTNDIPNEEQTSRLQQLAVSRIFSTAEEAREYMRSEGLDPEVEEAFGREVISELKAKVAAKKRN